ncbi:hypothetical protein B0J17DRAFT_217702 [Rhizoctonia solani]|nr:hypothetical protein B0J17DRAFT_217702 [Rhizoctonia solani]
MPAQISSILDGPAGPPPAIDKPSLRRLADAISALPETRLAALFELLVKSGIIEHDATLNLDLESLPIRVFRQVWHCVYDPSASGSPSDTAKRTILVAHVREEDTRHTDELKPKFQDDTKYNTDPVYPLPGPSSHSLKPEPDEHKVSAGFPKLKREKLIAGILGHTHSGCTSRPLFALYPPFACFGAFSLLLFCHVTWVFTPLTGRRRRTSRR